MQFDKLPERALRRVKQVIDQGGMEQIIPQRSQ
jgi:hypothetical protein